MEITYEHSFNLLESMKSDFDEGEEIITIIDFCEDLLSDSRLTGYPLIEINQHNSVIFNYENYDKKSLCNHLVIKIKSYGFGYDDKILSYFCINGNETSSAHQVSWNEIVGVINKWKNE